MPTSERNRSIDLTEPGPAVEPIEAKVLLLARNEVRRMQKELEVTEEAIEVQQKLINSLTPLTLTTDDIGKYFELRNGKIVKFRQLDTDKGKPCQFKGFSETFYTTIEGYADPSADEVKPADVIQLADLSRIPTELLAMELTDRVS